MKDERLLDAFNTWEELSQKPETIIAYQSRLKAIVDEEARLFDMHEKGIEEGIEQGIEQGILKVARELIALNVDVEAISKATGLSIEEIDTLKNQDL